MIDDYVLYADDDEDDRFFLSLSFEKNVFDKHLEAVSSGNELLKFLENHKDQKGLPCLIILDQKMHHPHARMDVVLFDMNVRNLHR